MCGIAGIFNYADPNQPVDTVLLHRMTRSLAHRGPDAEDFRVRGNIGFGHRRLSIVDLSPTGAQPMVNDDGSRWITYNGEFYNHADFRPRLTARGARFRGPSDTETLLRLMEQEGPDSLAETAGIFAFAFWDSDAQTLTLARDHMGVKQLYFHDDGRRIIFASEIKALLQDPRVPREPDREGVNQYLHFHTPLFDRTFFKDIRQIRAGEFLRINRHGVYARSYWSISNFNKTSRPENEQIDDLKHQLNFIVGEQLMADVPVGSFFSGGIDSSAVAANAAEVGKPPMCFGVHFTDQGVTDERPYQEAAAKALHLDLHLITMDGNSFPEDFRRLMYHQDQPVLGPALFPMAKVSELAARHVKVCLGGQAADEIFGGYARYALGRPTQVIKSWFTGRQRSSNTEASPASRPASNVGGNLARQFAEGGTLFRLARNARYLARWEASYFEHFAKIPEAAWQRLFLDPEFCQREACRQIFNETVHRSAATDPLDKIMLWDAQTYMTGLFHQDDRMSMAASLESRVPFADPRLVRFAFQIDPDLKLRGGASKWILRQAVADILPPLVLNRRKVGFDTPADRWLRGSQAGFVRDTLLSTRARQRGILNSSGISELLEHTGSAAWFDQIWKVLSIELWASIFLDSKPVPDVEPSPIRVLSPREAALPAAAQQPIPRTEQIGNILRECGEMGVKGTLARGLWELKTRSGFLRVKPTAGLSSHPRFNFLQAGTARLPFTPVAAVRAVISKLLSPAEKSELLRLAAEATRGQILCFSSWMADYRTPIDWHRDPTNGHRWSSDLHWSRVLRGAPGIDVKFTWEAARFPHTYQMARAAVLEPDAAPMLAAVFVSQVSSFITSNPPGLGVHWFSGQEVALRVFAWLFGIHVFGSMNLLPDRFLEEVGQHLYAAGEHLASHIEYARDSVYNNHLLSEALGLYIIGRLLPGNQAKSWASEGFHLLDQQGPQQIYPDGGYIQQGHNYHRVALQLYLLATAFATANGDPVPATWTGAMDRSLDFLIAHQNDEDGALPNYGANDGSLPILLSEGALPDFRPVLQAVSVVTRRERIYDRGSWDEYALWLAGPGALDYPARVLHRSSKSFAHTGYHVLRGSDTANFAAFRCGTILDRFSQIDMLHLDVWWRGQNILVDPGSYRYNGATRWHNHFLRTESHNTVQLDGRDQMLHFRQFKTLYWTEASLIRFDDNPKFALCEGEHYGYRRKHDCTHRRSVLMLKEGVWIVVDTVLGQSEHKARLHWLAGDFPFDFDALNARMTLHTPKGDFCVAALDALGNPARTADVVCGADNPPRGWLARHYGVKTPVPSLAAVYSGSAPITMVSILSPDHATAEVNGPDWTIRSGASRVRFRIVEGRFEAIFTEFTV